MLFFHCRSSFLDNLLLIPSSISLSRLTVSMRATYYWRKALNQIWYQNQRSSRHKSYSATPTKTLILSKISEDWHHHPTWTTTTSFISKWLFNHIMIKMLLFIFTYHQYLVIKFWNPTTPSPVWMTFFHVSKWTVIITFPIFSLKS